MKAMITVMLKELRDLSRDRRTLALALLLGPLLYPALMLGIGKLVEMRAATQLEKPLKVSIVGAQHALDVLAGVLERNGGGTRGEAERSAVST